MNYKKRCADCVSLIQKNGEWCCDECFGQRCCDIDDCPEGMNEEEMAQIDALEKIKIDHGASAEITEKKDKKPKTVKISDEKTAIFNDLTGFLDGLYSYEVVKPNKLIEIFIGDKKFKLDLIETRQKKSS